MVYSTFDWGIRDADGYFYILGRTDDVINVAGTPAGHARDRGGISSHPAMAEVAVVGVADALKGQVAMAFAVTRGRRRQPGARRRGHEAGGPSTSARWRGRRGCIRDRCLPKTRSGKLLRRAIQAVCEGRDPGDLTTIDDPWHPAADPATARP
jgi:propionyl-CoA synthetase